MADQKTVKHYVTAFVFMITWMGGPFVKSPSIPRANVADVTSRGLLPPPLSKESSASSKEFESKIAKFTQPHLPGHGG